MAYLGDHHVLAPGAPEYSKDPTVLTSWKRKRIEDGTWRGTDGPTA